MSARIRCRVPAALLFAALAWPLAGCLFVAEFGFQFVAYAIAGAAAGGGSQRSGQGEPATIRVVKASLIGGEPASGTELSRAQCHATCAVEEERCWYVEAHAPLLDEGVRVPMLVCGDGSMQQLTRAAAGRLMLAFDGERFESKHCEQLCPDTEASEAAACSLEWQAAPPVPVLRQDERLVLCERR